MYPLAVPAMEYNNQVTRGAEINTQEGTYLPLLVLEFHRLKMQFHDKKYTTTRAPRGTTLTRVSQSIHFMRMRMIPTKFG